MIPYSQLFSDALAFNVGGFLNIQSQDCRYTYYITIVSVLSDAVRTINKRSTERVPTNEEFQEVCRM